MNNYKIFLRNEFGELIETEQIRAYTIQDAIVQVKFKYDTIGRVKEV